MEPEVENFEWFDSEDAAMQHYGVTEANRKAHWRGTWKYELPAGNYIGIMDGPDGKVRVFGPGMTGYDIDKLIMGFYGD